MLLVLGVPYQRWSPLIWAVGSVVVHHLVVGLLVPHHVFGELVRASAEG